MSLLKNWHRFIQQNFNVFMRSAPDIHKKRRYEHVEIQQKFTEIETQRKKQRLALIEYRKNLKKKILQRQLTVLKESGTTQDQAGQYSSLEKYLEANDLAHLQKSNHPADKELLKELKSLQVQGKPKMDLYVSLSDEMDRLARDLAYLEKDKEELSAVDERIESLQPEYVLVQGIQRKILQNAMAYLDFQRRNMAGVVFSQEAQDNIETVHYQLEHNLPIAKQLLYEVFPEYFEEDIGKLEKEEQQLIESRRPKIVVDESNTIQIFQEDGTSRRPKDEEEHFLEKLLRQEYDLMDFVWQKSKAFYDKHHDHLDLKIKKGFYSVKYILTNLETRERELLTDEELVILQDLEELKGLQRDYLELKENNMRRRFNWARELSIPTFIQQSDNEKLKEFFIQRFHQIVSPSFDIKDSILVPESKKIGKESMLANILEQRKKDDLEALIEESKKEFNLKFGGDEPIAGPDRENKDEKMVRKLNLMVDVMHELPEFEEEQQKRAVIESQSLSQLPGEECISLDQLSKVLYLNNRDHRKYDLTFWAQHFNIYPTKLRNIFNYVAYPVIGENNEVTQVLRFIYSLEKDTGASLEQDDI